MTEETAKFWNWFKDNNEAYLTIDELEDNVKDELLNELQDRIHEYCDDLYFEIGGMPGEAQELIITAEGNTELFDSVEALVDDAPAIDKWIFTAFIQPQGGGNTINFEGVELIPAQMWFLPLKNAKDHDSIGIKVCTPNYEAVKENEWFRSAVYKTLDSVLGEKSFALDISYVDYGAVPDNPEQHGLIELVELPAYVGWRKRKQASD